MLASDVRWFEGASSSGGAGPLTSGAPSADSNSRYICEDWISRLSNNKLRFISREYRLVHSARWAAQNERLYLPPRGYMTFSEVILKTGVFLPLHPFIVQVLDYFDIIPFQFPPNSHRLIVAVYIIFSECYSVALSVIHFVFIYSSRPSLNMRDFGTLTCRGNVAGIAGLPSNTGPWKYNFFFYLSKCYGEFRVGCK